MIEVLERERKYPKISLTDSVINNIQIDNDTVTFMFDQYGFWVNNKEEAAFHRVAKASVYFVNCDIENINILLVEWIKDRFVATTLSFKTFLRKVNEKRWRFIVIREYLTDGGGIIYGCLHGRKRKHNECYLRIGYHQYGFRYSDELG